MDTEPNDEPIPVNIEEGHVQRQKTNGGKKIKPSVPEIPLQPLDLILDLLIAERLLDSPPGKPDKLLITGKTQRNDLLYI